MDFSCPESKNDQKIRDQGHNLPQDQEQDEVGGADHRERGRDEQRQQQPGEFYLSGRILAFEVAGGINRRRRRDQKDDENKEQGERVVAERETAGQGRDH